MLTHICCVRPPVPQIKGFALCCSETGYLISFEIYTGKRADVDGSPIAVIDRLLTNNGFELQPYRILYCDNWYTSQALMLHLWLVYKMLMVGTMRLTTKKSRTGADFPFAKLSNRALRFMKKGDYRRAVKNVTHNGKLEFVSQALVWKDRKLVGFLSNHLVEHVDELSATVLRWDRDVRKRVAIEAHPITNDYGLHMGGVDHMDRDLSNWGSSMRTARYYMRIFFWCFDSIVHCIHCIVAHYGHVEGHRWAKYTKKNDGRYKFQMDLAQTLIAAGIEMSWDGKDDSTKPKWMRTHNLTPCDCGTCYFCRRGLTHGIDHRVMRADGTPARLSPARKEYKHPTKRTPLTINGTHTQGYCRLCEVRERSKLVDGKPRKRDEYRKHCRRPTGGCPVCGVHICKQCWPKYVHDHQSTHVRHDWKYTTLPTPPPCVFD